MTEKEIRKYIDRLNNGKSSESIFTRRISPNVEVAKVWPEQPKRTDNVVGNFNSYRFFFIKDDSEKYVGAVLDMFNDLHWYVAPKSRKKGFLTSALKSAILPYLFEEGREIQRVSIEKNAIGKENYTNSKNVALKLGFEPINDSDSEFELQQSDFDWKDTQLEELDSEVEEGRIEELKKRAFYAYKILHQISDELLMTFDDDANLIEVAGEVKKYTWKIEDLEWSMNRSNK